MLRGIHSFDHYYPKAQKLLTIIMLALEDSQQNLNHVRPTCLLSSQAAWIAVSFKFSSSRQAHCGRLSGSGRPAAAGGSQRQLAAVGGKPVSSWGQGRPATASGQPESNRPEIC